VDAENASGRLVVTLGRQLFEGSALRPPGKTLLDRAAEVMRGHSGLRASVMGYTDDMGSVEYNQRVAQERADAVASHLAGSKLGDLAVKGIGEAQPRFPNTSRAGRRLNRRVELQIEAPGS
jgi:outer membrane protein OmpA-like peptidoglycan-associated protein